MSVSEQQRRQNRIIIGLIMGFPIAVILLSSLWYWLADNRVVELGTVNHGQLIQPPLQIDDISLRQANGQPLQYQQLADAQWTFLVVADGSCDAQCEKMLYLVRQTHMGAGKLVNDIRHAFLLLDDGQASGATAEKIVDSEDMVMARWRTERSAWQSLFADSAVSAVDPQGFFLVDRRGWIMMQYHADDLEMLTLSDLSKGVIKDMKRLTQ